MTDGARSGRRLRPHSLPIMCSGARGRKRLLQDRGWYGSKKSGAERSQRLDPGPSAPVRFFVPDALYGHGPQLARRARRSDAPTLPLPSKSADRRGRCPRPIAMSGETRCRHCCHHQGPTGRQKHQTRSAWAHRCRSRSRSRGSQTRAHGCHWRLACQCRNLRPCRVPQLTRSATAA